MKKQYDEGEVTKAVNFKEKGVQEKECNDQLEGSAYQLSCKH